MCAATAEAIAQPCRRSGTMRGFLRGFMVSELATETRADGWLFTSNGCANLAGRRVYGTSGGLVQIRSGLREEMLLAPTINIATHD